MKVLLLKDYTTGYAWGQLIVDSFMLHITQVPSAQVDICEACGGEALPSVDQYDLIILTGGTFNLLSTSFDEFPAWVQQVLNQIRDLAANRNNTKVLGICWGHQVVQFAHGATLSPLVEGSRVSSGDFPGRKLDIVTNEQRVGWRRDYRTYSRWSGDFWPQISCMFPTPILQQSPASHFEVYR